MASYGQPKAYDTHSLDVPKERSTSDGMPQIFVEIELLEEAIVRLGTGVEKMQERLSPMMVSSRPRETVESTTERVEHSPMATQLFSLRVQVDQIASRLQDTSIRLQV